MYTIIHYCYSSKFKFKKYIHKCKCTFFKDINKVLKCIFQYTRASISASRSSPVSTSNERDTQISSIRSMRHRVRGKSLSCPRFHVLSFLSFGTARADRKRGEIALGSLSFRNDAPRLHAAPLPFDSHSGRALPTFSSKKLNETTGSIENGGRSCHVSRNVAIFDVSLNQLPTNYVLLLFNLN